MPTDDQRREVESLLTRINILRSNPYIKHVISQPTPTIDFADVMQTKQIVLLRIPPWMDEESKSFIGTLVISQLLKTIFLRAEISEHLRTPFAIYCDEFQTFATPDFAKLFTQTGKFQIMPTVAHQERLGQFKLEDPNRGATLAAPNKVLFSLAVHDGEELAPEFAKEPTTTETRFEPVLVISQEPMWDLLRHGHANPRIQQFFYRFIRRFREYLDSLKVRMEKEKLQLMGIQAVTTSLRDTGALARVDEAWGRLGNDATSYGSRMDALSQAGAALESVASISSRAQEHVTELKILYGYYTHTLEQIHTIDQFFTAVMEGRLTPLSGKEQCAEFFIALVGSGYVKTAYISVMRLYLSLRFGDSTKPRAIPAILAHKYWPDELEAVYMAKQRAMYEIDSRKGMYTMIRVEEFLQKDLEEYREAEKRIGASFGIVKKLSNGSSYISTLPNLPPYILKADEIEMLLEICTEEIDAAHQREDGFNYDFMPDMEELVEICNLLAKPENHIKVASGQYVEKPVGVRLVSDMTNEMALELANLPRYTAWVKLIQEENGKQIVLKRKIKPLALPKEHGRPLASEILERSHATVYKPRDEIEADIREQQERWRRPPDSGTSPPRGRGGPPPRFE